MKCVSVRFDAVMVSPKREKPAGLCKARKEGKSVAVDSGNVRK